MRKTSLFVLKLCVWKVILLNERNELNMESKGHPFLPPPGQFERTLFERTSYESTLFSAVLVGIPLGCLHGLRPFLGTLEHVEVLPFW